ncbi:MAG: holo-[acyl-carrier-protein] synthase [Humidesulfovibrio sp.]|jgi:holo-[acyl-carrier protein] synthase|uniref:holo-[acyl-carrier-protein] synthase n=1 Tax=Humidesulfovibrio sp. TaxID=2910988 RepID=UPI002736232E|nr:holo-[acyl-carrier-protein] synthase [Humidesulfovibrio sp.]MDP2848910.1 holo-[acyl-carrier-protein] synthase [Humidesulfovibrio sp.]
MILGVGLDVAEISRIRDSLSRFGARFTSRVLTPGETAAMPENDPAPFVAARFAAKEACAKALGTGFANGVTMKSIEVRSLPSGAPTLLLSGRAQELANAMGAERLHLSLTHGRDVAAAVVILEGAPL